VRGEIALSADYNVAILFNLKKNKMMYKIYKIDKQWDLPFLTQEMKNVSLLVEVTDTFRSGGI
jgi:hypothetical protein